MSSSAASRSRPSRKFGVAIQHGTQHRSDAGIGELNNQGTHQLDMARWAIDDDQTHPVRAMATGGRFLRDDQGETPNTMFGIAQYLNGQWAFFNVRNVNCSGYQRQVENEYYFEDGGKIVRDVSYPKGSESFTIRLPGIWSGSCGPSPSPF